jgi:hypothetical protein
MVRCARAGVSTPCIYMVDGQKSWIFMEKIEGCTVRDLLRASYDDATATYSERAVRVAVSAHRASTSRPERLRERRASVDVWGTVCVFRAYNKEGLKRDS